MWMMELSFRPPAADVALPAPTELEEARQRGATASILLRLTQSLIRAETSDEVARRLAAAVPRVVGADDAEPGGLERGRLRVPHRARRAERAREDDGSQPR
jgi:hypothetical protein